VRGGEGQVWASPSLLLIRFADLLCGVIDTLFLLVIECTTLRLRNRSAPSHTMTSADYLPILVLILVSIAFAGIAILLPSVLGPKNPNRMKQEPIESGMIPFADARRRFPVQYYMVAVLFIIFDIEVIFLFPWAVSLNQLKFFGLIEMGIFLGILLIGYLYVWKKGAFEWE